MADKSRITKKYSNGEITIVWKPYLCIHSQKCFTGLPEVFDPAKRPWINASGAETKKIISQVEQCPSKALSFFKNSEGENQFSGDSETETVIEAKPNGPLFVYGNILIKKPDGSEEDRKNVTVFCRCGNSNNKPFCNGSHLKAGFKG